MPVHSVVRKSVMFSNVIVDIAFPRRSFVFGQSSCEVSASLTDVGGAAVGAIIFYTAPFLFLGSSLSSKFTFKLGTLLELQLFFC